jgi:hypothetical protein
LSQLNKNSIFSNLHFDTKKDSHKYVQTDFVINESGIFSFNIKHRIKVTDHTLRMILHQEGGSPADDNRIDIVYNSNHGLIINGEFMPVILKDAKSIHIIINSTN